MTANEIEVLNKHNVCTRGIGTYGCACAKCHELILAVWEQIKLLK